MRHHRAGVHLSRTSAHRAALFSNLVAALFHSERIRTTWAKAHETRRLAERTITWARRLGDVLTKAPERRSPQEAARVVHAIRMARRVVRDRSAVMKLFNDIGPRFLGRQGGYTRMLKIGPRPGDAAPMVLLELMPDEAPSGGKGKGSAMADDKAAATEKQAAGKKRAGKQGGAAKTESKAAKPDAKAKPKVKK